MYRIHQLKAPVNQDENKLKTIIASYLGISIDKIVSYSIFKRSIDARNKSELHYVYAVDVEIKGKPVKRFKPNELSIVKPFNYIIPACGNKPLNLKPVIIGLGPAGLFCAYLLAQAGFKPICFERGCDVDERLRDVEKFFSGQPLNPDSNVAFGEGGAGTFSDGKLNTLVKDKDGKGRYVLSTFVKFGANPDIMYDAKPHIGTDKLISIVKAMREEIISLGGEVHFKHKLEDVKINSGSLNTVIVNGKEIPAGLCVLATGHSARDTFSMLYNKGLHMEPKPFAIGVRVMHKQSLIDKNQYGDYAGKLPAASYKLTHTCENGRSVYSFCMCPGGYVVNASSEDCHTVVNGMSYSGRDSENANAAIICNVTPDDFEKEGFGNTALAGVEFQRKYEALTYQEGNGLIPVQQLNDFNADMPSEGCGKIKPLVKGGIKYGNVRRCLPDYVSESISEAMNAFDKKIPGFGDGDTLMLGIETRTSSPVKIVRNEMLQSDIKGLFPCGEGAGYAGGIMSAALDGMRVAEYIISTYSRETND